MGANIMAGIGMAGVGMSAYSAYQQAEAEKYSRAWNSLMAGQQAEIAKAKAATYRQLGQQERFETELEYQGLESTQRAQYSASGVDVNVGSALQTQLNTRKQGIYEGQKAEWQREQQAWEMDMEEQTHRLEQQFGMASNINPWASGLASAIGGTTSVYNMYAQWQK